ncbi:S1/P1 nuclease [Aquimarina addita]|uniref:S1/P1 nuclease n=1 Tax=Aquimarina addita TaxID=870485 RepID=A0ABP7X9B3_9FLAO
MNTRYVLLSVFLLFSIYILPANYDWGKTGHRVTGEIAEKYLSKKTKRAIDELLNGHSLAFVSIYADEIKSDDRYRKYSALHYVNFSFDKKYGEETPSERGDLIQGIGTCVEVLKSKTTTKDDKEFHLKMLIHFIGDLHQPLHVGRGEDKGGNDIQVRWFNEGSNLHRVWDSDMIDNYGMSYIELSQNTDELSLAQINDIKKGDVLDWTYETQALAKEVYASANVGEKLSYKYMYEQFPIVRAQLQKGGIRLAKMLNDIFEN